MLTGVGIEPNTIKRRGTGFRGYDRERVSPGFTLFTPNTGDGLVALVDIEGNLSHTWHMPCPPGLHGYLTDRGTLFYNGKIANDSFTGQRAYQGGVAMEVDWQGNVRWEVHFPDHHHDGRLLRNGNLVLLCAAPLPREVANQVQGGLPGTDGEGPMYSDYLAELTTTGDEVWEWRVWEHLDPGTHPVTSPADSRQEWTHGNTGIELPDGNLLFSMRNISTVVRINRLSGDIKWELGPPPLSGMHTVNPLPNGNLLLFDNGPFRADQARASQSAAQFSRVLEVDPATNTIVWEYRDVVPHAFFSALISNAQRLPNNNTLVNEGLSGRIFEVTPEGDVVWEYVNPYFGPSSAAPKAQTNNVFRAYRYTEEEIARARTADSARSATP